MQYNFARTKKSSATSCQADLNLVMLNQVELHSIYDSGDVTPRKHKYSHKFINIGTRASHVSL